jgi:hypothetical protein
VRDTRRDSSRYWSCSHKAVATASRTPSPTTPAPGQPVNASASSASAISWAISRAIPVAACKVPRIPAGGSSQAASHVRCSDRVNDRDE